MSANTKRVLTAAAVGLAGATALFYARCAFPELDKALGFPIDRQVQTCSIKGGN